MFYVKIATDPETGEKMAISFDDEERKTDYSGLVETALQSNQTESTKEDKKSIDDELPF